MSIPCFILIFNQHSWPAAMIPHVERLGLKPILIDNGSTYPPCVEWLDSCGLDVVRFESNGGPRAWFTRECHREQRGYYAFTDSDLDISSVPTDAVDRLLLALDDNQNVPKAGLSLEIDDIPKDHPIRPDVLIWELPNWNHPAEGGCFNAQVDTTFSLYDPSRHALLDQDFYRAVRTPRPYTARHLPWYLDFDHLSDETVNYLELISPKSYWSNRIRRYRKTGEFAPQEFKHD